MNRKGFLPMAMVDFWSLILIIVILIGFTYIFFVTGLFTGKSTRLLEAEANLEASSLLLGYLRYNVDNGDMIEFMVDNIDDMDAIGEKTREILNKACSLENKCYWQVELLRKGQTYKINGEGSQVEFENKGQAEFLLPRKDEKIVVRLVKYSDKSLVWEIT